MLNPGSRIDRNLRKGSEYSKRAEELGAEGKPEEAAQASAASLQHRFAAGAEAALLVVGALGGAGAPEGEPVVTPSRTTRGGGTTTAAPKNLRVKTGVKAAGTGGTGSGGKPPPGAGGKPPPGGGGGKPASTPPPSAPPPSKRAVVGGGTRAAGNERPGDVTFDTGTNTFPDYITDIRDPLHPSVPRGIFDEVLFERVPSMALTDQAFANARALVKGAGAKLEVLTAKGADAAAITKSAEAAGFTDVQATVVKFNGVDVLRVTGVAR